MKISIVTPSFNQALFIEQTIDSILSQGYSDLEYIIIDGGSSDSSVDIIKRYSKYLSYWVSEPDFGQSHAIQKGLLRSSGEVFNWVNSDDFLEPGALKTINERFQVPSIRIFCGVSNIVSTSGTIRTSKGTDIYLEDLPKTLGLARIDQPETWIRKETLHGLGGLNPRLNYVMDKDIWIRYLCRFGLDGILKTNDLLTNFRLHAQSKSVSKSDMFEPETNSLFLELAEVNGFNDLKRFLKLHLKVDDNFENVGSYLLNDVTVAAKALNYFILYQADKAYFNRDRSLCQLFLSKVEKSFLSESDRKLLRRLKFRSARPIFDLNDVFRKS